MKQSFFILLILGAFTVMGQDKNQIELLNKFITAHNSASESEIVSFIRDTYDPALQKKIDMKKHVDFYDHIVKEFGPLNDKIYKIEEVKSTKLIVHLIKKDESINNRLIDPSEILVVEIDILEPRSKYLSRGLGLGALICSRE